jgi:hypothetical protein
VDASLLMRGRRLHRCVGIYDPPTHLQRRISNLLGGQQRAFLGVAAIRYDSVPCRRSTLKRHTYFPRLSAITAILLAGVATLHAQNTLTVNPSVVFINATVNGAPVQVPVSVSSAPTAVIQVTPSISSSTPASWLTFAASGPNTPATISFIGNPSGLAAGVYNAVVNLSSPLGTTLPVVVVMTVNNASPLASTPNSLTFNYSQAGSLPGAQSLMVTSAGALH